MVNWDKREIVANFDQVEDKTGRYLIDIFKIKL